MKASKIKPFSRYAMCLFITMMFVATTAMYTSPAAKDSVEVEPQKTSSVTYSAPQNNKIAVLLIDDSSPQSARVVAKKMKQSSSTPDKSNPLQYYDNITLERDLQALLWTACEETGCCFELALAVIHQETGYNNINGDNGNSIGYMQIQPRWNKDRMNRLGVTNLQDPLSNFRVGCDLLAELMEKYKSIEKALTCYNTGKPGASKYANKVMAYMNTTFGGDEISGNKA